MDQNKNRRACDTAATSETKQNYSTSLANNFKPVINQTASHVLSAMRRLWTFNGKQNVCQEAKISQQRKRRWRRIGNDFSCLKILVSP